MFWEQRMQQLGHSSGSSSCMSMSVSVAEDTVKPNDGRTFSRHYLPQVHLGSSLCEIKRIIWEL